MDPVPSDLVGVAANFATRADQPLSTLTGAPVCQAAMSSSASV